MQNKLSLVMKRQETHLTFYSAKMKIGLENAHECSVIVLNILVHVRKLEKYRI